MKQTHDDRLVQEVIDVFTQFTQKQLDDDDEEKAWMLEQCPDPQVQAILREMTLTMLHVLDAIGKIGRANGSTLSSQFGIPKGTVSKLTRRLASHGLIVIEKIPGNNKELHFTITPLGETIYKLHERLDDRIHAAAVRFMSDYTDEQLVFIRDLMQKLVSSSFLQHDE